MVVVDEVNSADNVSASGEVIVENNVDSADIVGVTVVVSIVDINVVFAIIVASVESVFG